METFLSRIRCCGCSSKSCCLSSSSSSVRMKMISLLLLILSSCLCAATFVVNVTQSSYEAEENHSITLEWTFTTRTNSSPASLFIYCKLRQNQTDFVIYHVFMGVEASLYLDKRFTGRVQSDKDVLREGRIRLHVSRLRTEDSGLYLCQVNTDYGWGSASLQLNIKKAPAVGPTVRTKPERKGTSAYLGLISIPVVISVLIFGFILFIRKKRQKKYFEDTKRQIHKP
ncbi:uncharacterized protein LOC106938884 isoform X1 [Poecilia latipinna]|uniref:uncharacterized protein LOC106938884 isoform X1 n=1 Tax=Poecilia latipinna TaxID=48699 RepID=UPI00072DA0DE|nr:PREDICTED: uncharacterized protein LOC106938884 isoform X1 [Poecilia latipinna]